MDNTSVLSEQVLRRLDSAQPAPRPAPFHSEDAFLLAVLRAALKLSAGLIHLSAGLIHGAQPNVVSG